MSEVGLAVVASLLSGAGAAALAWTVLRPTPRLAPRVRPYTVASRSSLGRSADVLAVARPTPALSGRTLSRLFGPPVRAVADRVGQLVDTTSDERLALKLRQAGILTEIPQELRVQEYRTRQLGSGMAFSAAGGLLLAVPGSSPARVLLALVLGFVAGVTRWRGRVDRAIEDRRARMRIELYTVNQLLAMHVRVGGGVVQAVRRVVERGSGVVVEELAAALVAHETGLGAADAFGRIAQLTPEASAARTYKLLAAGAEWGADLAEGLLALSEDVRDQRRETLRRNATRRRAAMLVPIIGILAPVMLLFVAAPLPSLLFGGR